MDGESWGHFLERAFREGALDVYFTPVQMKKNRPGVLLSILCQPADQERFAALIFRETTTLGLRKSITRRLVLDRETRKLDTQFGEVRIKIGRFKGQVANISPEYEDLRRITKETGLPFKVIKQKLMDDWEDNLL
jgi:hypothetical protein